MLSIAGPAPLTEFGQYEQDYLNHYDHKQQVEAQNRYEDDVISAASCRNNRIFVEVHLLTHVVVIYFVCTHM